MARFLFLENREKTKLWEAVSNQLQSRGHDIHWLVQNPVFRPRAGQPVTIIPFPVQERSSINSDSREDFPVLVTERGRDYFASGSAHYSYYQQYIKNTIRNVQPTVIVGECTLFHELLSIEAAKQEGIPFLHPAGERYQNDRFHLFCGDTQEIFCKGPDIMPEEDAENLAAAIIGGHAKPKYMISRTGVAALSHRMKWAWTRGMIWLSALRGERFNTPSLTIKSRLARHRKTNIIRWQKIASSPQSSEISLLYPMQMQPEANIDVWGRPFSDQVSVIERLAIALPAGASLLIKANPKIKYEISDALLDLVEARDDVKLLPLDTSMAAARKATIGTVTVSGTVGHEAVFGLGRCISLRHPILRHRFSKFAADTPEEAVAKLFDDDSSGIGCQEDGVELIKQLFRHSFRGYISDPFNDSAVLERNNVSDIANALETALDHIAPIKIPN